MCKIITSTFNEQIVPITVKTTTQINNETIVQTPIFVYILIMDTTLLIYLVAGTVVVAFLLGWYLRVQGRKELQAAQRKAQQQEAVIAAQPKPFGRSNPEIRRLQLQAYERCIILCERMSFSSLLDRSDYKNLNAVDLKNTLIQNVKTEFDYNLSQQLYLSPTAWDGLTKLKEQQIFIINQIAAFLPANASGNDMAVKIMELLSLDENASIQPIIADLLRKEARQLML